tara:strand:- start:5517 stop:7289 length:1773 start_codon:yes stop_codon:yes gene_type:complete
MKKKLIFTLRNVDIRGKDKYVLLNSPNSFLIKKKFNNEFFYSKRWKYPKNINKDFEYLNEIYERILTHLAKFLNTYHDVNFTKQYWRVILGTWLYRFICVVFERWNSLKEVNSKYKKININFLKYNSEDFIPYGIEDFSYFTQTDSWNSYIFFELINNFKFNSIDKEYTNEKLLFKDVKEIYRRLSLGNNNNKKRIFNNLQKFLSKNNKNLNYLIFNTYLSNLEEIKINLKLNKKLVLFKSLKFVDLYINLLSSNKKLSNKRAIDNKVITNNFNDFLFKFCKKNIPKCYLEYFDLTGNALKKFELPKKPKVIFSTLGVGRSTIMDRYTAGKVKSGTKLVLGQHGGNYGQHKVHWGTIHEHKISDRFFSWGFKYGIKTKPLGIIKKIEKIKFNKKNKLIVFEFRSRGLYSQALKIDAGAINNKIYMQNICKFFLNLNNKEILANLRVKLHPIDFGLEDKKFLLESNNKIKFLNPKQGTKNLYNKAKLVIHTFASTGHLECMACNIPMLILFVNDMSLLEHDTRKFFNEFKEIGILHDNPISLSKMLKKISKDPGKWWFSNKIQLIRKKYVDEFGILNQNLVADIVQNLRKI